MGIEDGKGHKQYVVGPKGHLSIRAGRAGNPLIPIGMKWGGRTVYVYVPEGGLAVYLTKVLDSIGLKTGEAGPYGPIPKAQAGKRINRIAPKTGIRKSSPFERSIKAREADLLARSLPITAEEMPTAAAELRITTVPSKNWYSDHTEEQERKGPLGPGMSAPEGSS